MGSCLQIMALGDQSKTSAPQKLTNTATERICEAGQTVEKLDLPRQAVCGRGMYTILDNKWPVQNFGVTKYE